MNLLTAERKTKVAALVTFLVALAGLSALNQWATDLTALPDWLEAPAYAAILALSGYVARHRPADLSPSAEQAFRAKYGPGRQIRREELPVIRPGDTS